MIERIYFKTIPVTVDERLVFRRLKFMPGLTRMSARSKREFRVYIDQGYTLAKLSGVVVKIPIVSNTGSRVALAGGIVFESVLLAKLLKDCHTMVGMGVTAGAAIYRAIQDSQKNNLTRSVLIDALASELVDACFPWIRDFSNQQTKREGSQVLARRISCGYGDFHLRYQKLLYDIVGLRRLKITLTKQYMLIPEKSVTAVTGLRTVRS